MWPFTRETVVPVLRFTGAIGMITPLRPGLSAHTHAGAIEKAFSMSDAPSVAIVINSPGGSPVQSNLIYKRIRRLAEQKGKRVYAFCEDVVASGGYFLAIAGDEIYADPASIVGSIGVISSGFGFVEALDKLGIERRVYTSGHAKNVLDPFLPENPEDVARLKSIQGQVHEAFIGLVRERRAGKLKGEDAELFSGAFWAGSKAVELGLADGLADVHSKMRAVHGKDVRLKLVEPPRAGLFSRFRRGFVAQPGGVSGLAFGDDLVSAIEARALWSRFGL